VYGGAPARRDDGVAPGPRDVAQDAAGEDLVQKDPEIVFTKGMSVGHTDPEPLRGESPTPSQEHDLQHRQEQRRQHPAQVELHEVRRDLGGIEDLKQEQQQGGADGEAQQTSQPVVHPTDPGNASRS
jgi:hypothetical protein